MPTLPETQADTQILIAGAGPTGLVLALWLARRGVRVRIIDKVAEPGTTSRALAVQARTLEFYRQLGIADTVVAAGIRFVAINLWSRGRRQARIPLGDLGIGESPFPFILIFPQDEHEQLLIRELAASGVTVERPTELLDFEEGDEGVTARLRRADGSEERCTAEYLVGCDGARSCVRETLGTGFAGGTYAHLFYVADVVGHGKPINGELHGVVERDDFLAVFPMKGEHRGRFIGAVPPDAAQGNRTLTWDDLHGRILETMGIQVERVNWFSTYHVHHRMAGRFRVGRVFLAGDAAHIHSPVGGQGMNTGIGDAVNLAWKLAAVVQGQSDASLLDSYEPERMAFARRLVRTTDRGFIAVTSPRPMARFIRSVLIPLLLPPLTRLAAVRLFMFRTVSQTMIRYRDSALSSGSAGTVHGGDRLPWVALGGAGEPADNFLPLASLQWQLHVYGIPPAPILAACTAHGIPVHTFGWRQAMSRSGLLQNGAYLIRPDGHVAWAGTLATTGELEHYLNSTAP